MQPITRLLLAFAICPFVICACNKAADPAPDAASTGTTGKSSEPPKTASKPEDEVLGTWKVDVANTTLTPPDEKSKAEEASMRLEVKADGTYNTTGMAKPDAGKWSVKDHIVTFTAAAGTNAPPPMTLSDDGAKMSVTLPGEKPMTMVMIKE